MRLLIINANTSDIVTGKVETAARGFAAPGTTITAVTGHFGADVIGSRSEHAIAEHAAIDLMAQHAADHDAILIAVSYDTGLGAARELFDIPVIGMTEAMLLTACTQGGQIGFLSLGKRVLPLYQELVRRYGLTDRIAGWRALESSVPYAAASAAEAAAAFDQMVVDAALDLIERDGAEVIALTGAVMAGAGQRLQDRVPVPMVDGIQCGVAMAEMLARLRIQPARTGSYARPTGRTLRGVAPHLAAWFNNRD